MEPPSQGRKKITADVAEETRRTRRRTKGLSRGLNSSFLISDIWYLISGICWLISNY
jgi:hypothetical protein